MPLSPNGIAMCQAWDVYTQATGEGTFLRCIDLPEAMADWSLTSLQMKLIKIGARVVRHARAITFQLAEVAVTGPMVRAILAAIRRLREPPLCA
jgi:regulation of enolase protein 1 (concanavalin A-like superfamily)